MLESWFLGGLIFSIPLVESMQVFGIQVWGEARKEVKFWASGSEKWQAAGQKLDLPTEKGPNTSEHK